MSYSFAGFYPGTITISVQGGGQVIGTVRSDGTGNGAFYDTDQSGTYVLQAIDSIGSWAIVFFIIP